jgi:membrane protease YdiL (CAAX protease family)
MDLNYEGTAVTKSFGAKQAAGIFLAFILVMIFASFLVSLLIEPLVTTKNSGVSEETRDTSVGAILVLQQLIGLVMACYFTSYLLKLYFPGPLRDVALAEIGLIKCSYRLYSSAALFGFFLSLFFARVLGPLFPPDKTFVPNPLMSETQTGDWIQFLTAFTVVFVGPAVEEFLYRGVLYRGFSNSWGKYSGGFFISVLFVLLHNETLIGGYWLSITALILNAIFLLALRILSGSIIPSIFMHMGMNLALVLPI